MFFYFQKDAKSAASAAFRSHECSPLTPRAVVYVVDSDVEWTPGLDPGHDDVKSESENDSQENESLPVSVFNLSMANLAEVAGKNIEPLKYRLESWEESGDFIKQTFSRKAKQACQLVCEAMAPRDGEKLFKAVQQAAK